MMKSKPNLNIRLIDWHECDEREVEETEYTDKSGNLRVRKKITYDYVIRMFGITKKGTSITVHVTDFQPKFYVKIPEKWGKSLKQIDGKCRLLENEIHTSYGHTCYRQRLTVWAGPSCKTSGGCHLNQHRT